MTNKISQTNSDCLAKLFKVLSNNTRIDILCFLKKKESPVNEIAKGLNLSQSAVSHQLKYLKEAEIIKSRREGQLIYYSLVNNHIYQAIVHGHQYLNKQK